MTDLDRGARLLQEGDVAKALLCFEQFVAQNPESEDGRLLRAISLARLGRPGEAKLGFIQLLQDRPECYDALVWMAEISYGERDFEAAVKWAQKASDLRPDQAESHGVLGRAYLRLGFAGQAVDALQKAVSIAPEVAQYHHFLGLSFEHAQNRSLAIEHWRKAIDLAPQNPQSYLALAGSYSRFGHAGQALDVLKEAFSKTPNSAALHSHAAAAFTQIRNDQAAESHHRQATKLSQDAKIAYALWLVDQGRYDDALHLYEELISENPRLGACYYGILQCRKLTPEDGALIEKMEVLLLDPKVSPTSRMFLSYALGKVREGLKEYEAAMRHYDLANRLAYEAHSPAAPFDLPTLHAQTESIVQCGERLRKDGVWGLEDRSPIFVIGMIRSGTTLLDQIVSSHPLVSNAGELRFWTEKSHWLAGQETISKEQLSALSQEYLDYVHHLLGDCTTFTDKMPLNFFYAGIIHRAFPNARFLHIRRHPVDTCLSIYTTYFGTGSYFVYNKANTVAYYHHYQKIMDMWRTELPQDRLLELDYEDLISNREPTVRKVIDFCGLPWDDACLHHEDNKSAINTPSRWQARQPVYKTSMERWRNYEPWLGEFADLLE